MNILHISDFHYKTGTKFIVRQQQAIQHFIKSGKIEEEIDLIIFSGDLVNNGENSEDFNEAYNMLIQPLLDYCNIDESRVFICPGNHDVNRKEVLNSIVTVLDSMTSDEKLNEFLKEKDYQYSLKATENYNKFIEKKIGNIHDSFNPMFTTHKRLIDQTQIGIVSINSAWRSVGKNDNNNLLFPTDKLHEALGFLGATDFNILLLHHPLSDFREFNSSNLEDIIHKNFNLVLTGHIHKNKDSINLLNNTDVIFIGAPAALSLDPNSQIGIGIIKIDFEEYKFKIKKMLYDNENQTVYEVQKGDYDLPSTATRREINAFRLKLKSKYKVELDKVRHLMISKEETLNKHIKDICTDPVLKSKPQIGFSEDGKMIPSFDWADLNNSSNDYHIFGPGKCGKTILLKKVELDLLEDFPNYQTIPYYISCKDTAYKDGINLETEFFRHFEINRAAASNLVSNNKILLLIDNYHFAEKAFIASLESILNNHKNIRIIICSDESILTPYENVNINGRTVEKLFFHRLRKKHIKQLSQKIHNLPVEKEEEIVEKIESIFNRLSIPFNFWTISLFIWIFKKDLNGNFQNDVELVNLYVEKLLEKEKLTVEQSTFSYDKYKRYLAFLAANLLNNYSETVYRITYIKLMEFTEEYLSKNPRNNITAREVLNYIEEKGIIKKTDNDLYTFRLNGVFEFFIAQYMIIENNFLSAIIESDSDYLSYINEFELYAGFKRDDDTFLGNIYQKTQKIFSGVNSKYNPIGENNLDQILKSNIQELNVLKSNARKITTRLKDGLSLDEQDQIEEDIISETGMGIDTNSEIKVKHSNYIDSSIESLDKALSILGRVYKNIDEISNEKLVYEIFDFILNTTCNWGFQIIEELKNPELIELSEESEELYPKELVKLLTELIPTIVQAKLYDIIGHKNLEKIILNRIDIYFKESKNNQYLLFVLYYLLVDINPRQNKEKLDNLINILTIPILQYSSVLKLNFYIGFKAGDDKRLLDNFKTLLQRQWLKFDPEVDINKVHKEISKSIDTSRAYKRDN